MDVIPYVFPFSNNHRVPSFDTGRNNGRYLLGCRILQTNLSKGIGSYTPDGGGHDNETLDISCRISKNNFRRIIHVHTMLIRLDNIHVDLPMGLSNRQSLDFRKVKVRINRGRLKPSKSIIYKCSRTGLK